MNNLDEDQTGLKALVTDMCDNSDITMVDHLNL